MRSIPFPRPGGQYCWHIVWGIPKAQSIVVIRKDATVVSDASVYFSSDRTAVRATLRVGFGFTYPAAVIKITTSP